MAKTNREACKQPCLLTVFVLSDALQRDTKEGGVGVIVPNQQLRSSGNVHTRSVEDAGPATQQGHRSETTPKQHLQKILMSI